MVGVRLRSPIILRALLDGLSDPKVVFSHSVTFGISVLYFMVIRFFYIKPPGTGICLVLSSHCVLHRATHTTLTNIRLQWRVHADKLPHVVTDGRKHQKLVSFIIRESVATPKQITEHFYILRDYGIAKGVK